MELARPGLWARIPDLDVHFAHWPGRGPAVLLLHGLGSTLHAWDLVAPPMADRFDVYAMDLRGHGLTTQPEHGYDFATILRDVAAFVASQMPAGPVWLAGHSWGASLALQAAAEWGSRVAGAALVDGGILDMKASMPSWEQAEARLTPPALDGLDLDALRRGIRESWLSAAWSPEVEEAALHNFGVGPHGFIYRRTRIPNHLKIVRALWEFTPGECFGRVVCPVLIAPARMREADPGRMALKERAVQAAADAMPRATLRWFEDTIHDIPWHRPAELATALANFMQ